MHLFRNTLTVLSLTLSTLGLISCSQDKPVEYDMWENAPILTIQHDGETTLRTTSEATTLTTQDSLLLADATTQKESLEGVAQIETLINCENSLNTNYTRNETLKINTRYKVLDLLPVEALTSQMVSIEKSSELTCSLGLKLTNTNGSTRKRILQNVRIQFDLSKPNVHIFNPKTNSKDSLMTLTSEETVQTYIESSQSSEGIFILSCTDFQSTQPVTPLMRLSDLSLKPNLTNEPDLRKVLPKQTCRLYQRLSNSETWLSPEFKINYPISNFEIKSTAAYNETWVEATMHTMNIVRTIVTNTNSFAIQIRFQKALGTVQQNVMAGTPAAFGNSSPTVRHLTLGFAASGAVDIQELEGYYFATLSPGSTLTLLAQAAIERGCFSSPEIAGMDFTLTKESSFTIERGERLLTPETLSHFVMLSQHSLNLSNVYRVSGSGRETYYLPWERSVYPKLVLEGAPTIGAKGCWN